MAYLPKPAQTSSKPVKIILQEFELLLNLQQELQEDELQTVEVGINKIITYYRNEFGKNGISSPEDISSNIDFAQT